MFTVSKHFVAGIFAAEQSVAFVRMTLEAAKSTKNNQDMHSLLELILTKTTYLWCHGF